MRSASTPAEIEAANNLRRIYEAKKYGPEKLTQVKLAAMMGFKQQVAVSQYLNGKNVLGTEAIAKFAAVLGVEPTDIRPDFYDLLPIKPLEKQPLKVAVRCSLSGDEPRQLIITTMIEEPSAVGHYAVLVDTKLYRRSRIKENAHLIVGEGLSLERDDDVYVETFSGDKYIATYIGQNHQDKTFVLRCLARDEIIELPKTDVTKIDVIVGVENPTKERTRRDIAA